MKMKTANPPVFEAVALPINATRFRSEAEAEGVAMILTTVHPHILGRVEVKDHALGDRPDYGIRIHDFTVNLNG